MIIDTSFISPKITKKYNEDKQKIIKKNGETFPIIEFPTDYTQKEPKGFKFNSANPNTSPMKYDLSNHQAIINSTTYKLDKEVIMNLNGMIMHQPDLELKSDK